jgi:hypothetical protein
MKRFPVLNSLLAAGWFFLGVYGSTQVQGPLWMKFVPDLFIFLPCGLICLRDAWRSWRQRRDFVNNGPAIERIS